MPMLLNVADYRERARRALPAFAFDYIDGAADDESALRRNGSALDGMRLVPRCLADVSAIDTSTELFGQRWRLPFGIAPTGLNGLCRPDGDVALARAAAAAGVAFTQSTASNGRIETVAAAVAAADAPRPWLQLYVMSERGIAEQMMRRARAAGFGALVLTVDVPVSGNRERDVRNGFRLPFRPGPRTLLDLCAHPRWLARYARGGAPRFVNLSERDDGHADPQLQAALLARAMDRALAWDKLAWLREHWDGPLLVKGILHADDARRARSEGVDGIIVSNHGGRQLDAAPATIEVLPAIVRAVGPAYPVLVDGGFRRGTDIAKALALGARAVMLGRATMYGLAADGERGAKRVLDILAEELIRTMTLLGAADVAALQPGHVWCQGQAARASGGDSHE